MHLLEPFFQPQEHNLAFQQIRTNITIVDMLKVYKTGTKRGAGPCAQDTSYDVQPKAKNKCQD
jgi:hypothetical protein